MKNILLATLVLGMVVLFIYSIFHFLPLGMAIAVMGGIVATYAFKPSSKLMYIVGTLGSWAFPIGVIYSFIFHGWIVGLLSIFFGFMAYRYAKDRS